MKHTRSSAEVEIRDAVVMRFREIWPNARIIHEMNVEHGSSRADVVAVQPDRLWICEIKSEKDKLDRLVDQLRDYGPSCHGIIIAAHERWTKTGGYEPHPRLPGAMIEVPSPLRAVIKDLGAYTVWSHPEPPSATGRQWFKPYQDCIPHYHRMLRLLWSDELRAVANQHRVVCTQRTPANLLSRDLARLLSGKEIERAVCRMLRIRQFAEADPPIETEYFVQPSAPVQLSVDLTKGGAL